MGCGGSKNERAQEARSAAQRRRKKKSEHFTNLDDPAPSTPPHNPLSADKLPQHSLSPKEQTLEMKKLSINPAMAAAVPISHAVASQPLSQTVSPYETVPASRATNNGPITGTIDPGKKVTLRQTIQLAIQIAKQQREKVGKFRRDERHSVMELYELLGLETDAPIAPQTEYQQQLSKYNFPPDNMHMLRDVEVIDESSVILILGEEEYRRRKGEGTVEVSAQKVATGTAPRRAGVSAEVRGKADIRTLDPFKSKPKTRAQTEALTSAIRKTILFRGLDEAEITMLFNAFEPEEFNENTVIFEKGDEGDRFYLIESGRCQIILTDEDGTEKGSVFVGDGDTFGELGVMYGTPRAATVVAVLQSKMWWIDRDTYRGLLLVQTMKKRERFTNFLKSLDIFTSIDDYERTRIADVLESMEVKAGTIIVREGEPGDTFYMIEEGRVEVSSQAKGVLTYLGTGKYFGELALLFDKPRAATVKATTDVKMCVLGRANFVNYLGPFENILRRNADQYKRVLQAAAMG
jgi:cAMP-dependent protein kinase regulator